jgi:hypothetical protein
MGFIGTDTLRGGVRLVVVALVALGTLRSTAEDAPATPYDAKIAAIEAMLRGVHAQNAPKRPATELLALERRPEPEPVAAPVPAAHVRRTGRSDEFTYLVDRSGVPLLTNAPREYLQLGHYSEVTIKWNPITVPKQLKKGRRKGPVADQEIREAVQHYARRYNLDENLVYAVIRAESNFNPYAVSPAGARGLMQLMPSTAVQMNVTDIFDPAQNIAGGTQYLALMLRMFGNNTELALAAYNAGPGAVQKHGGVPPFAETRQYIARVKRFMSENGGARVQVNVATASPPLDEPKAAANAYRVHFTRSKLTQLADEVTEKNGYYFIRYGSRVDQVPMSYVARVDNPA